MPARTASRRQSAENASGPALKRYLGATVRTADRIDYWIRCHVIDAPAGPARHIPSELWSADAAANAPLAAPARASARQQVRPSRGNRPGPSKLMLACDRRTWLSALGQSLKAQYDALAAPVPPRLAALVRQLEAQDQMSRG
jgi:hypothetical protein